MWCFRQRDEPNVNELIDKIRGKIRRMNETKRIEWKKRAFKLEKSWRSVIESEVSIWSIGWLKLCWKGQRDRTSIEYRWVSIALCRWQENSSVLSLFSVGEEVICCVLRVETPLGNHSYLVLDFNEDDGDRLDLGERNRASIDLLSSRAMSFRSNVFIVSVALEALRLLCPRGMMKWIERTDERERERERVRERCLLI